MKIKIEKNPEKRLTSRQRKIGAGKGFVYHQSSQPFYRVKILLKNLEREPELYVNKIERRVYKIDLLIRFLRVLEGLGQDIARLHGGAVAKNNNEGVLFSAWSDVGKTTLALLLSRSGYCLIGDDAVKISKEGTLYRIQQKAGIFPHRSNLRNLPLSLREKAIGRFKYYFVRTPAIAKFIYPNLWVSYERIGKSIDRAKLKQIYILEKGEPEVSPMDKKTAIRKCIATTFAAASPVSPGGFPQRLFYKYCFANNISPTFIAEKYKEILSSAFENKEIFFIRGQTPFDFYKLFLENEKKQS
jgi:hypothetical protein